MPSYAHLFRGVDSDGEALVRYLASLDAERMAARYETVCAWRPAETARPIRVDRAREIFARSCSQCHGAAGRGDGELAPRLSVPPPNWAQNGWRRVPRDADVALELGRIIKFGLPGSPMAGHEYFPDDVVLGLAQLVQTWHKERQSRSAE